MTGYLALAVISAAALAYEVLLVRFFAIVQWHHFAFMAISIALLGFGASGSLLFLLQDWAKRRFTAVFAGASALFGASAPASFLLAQALPFNALAVVWEPRQLLYLPALYLLLTIPFLCAGVGIGLAFVRFDQRIGRVYACNLAGSAAGALGIVGTLFVFDPADNLRLVAALGFVAAALAALPRRSIRSRAVSVLAVAAAVAVWTLVPEAWLALRMSPYKGLPQALEVSGARLAGQRSGPLGLLSVVESPEVPFRYVPGLSLNAPNTPPDQLGVFVDGGAMTAITRFDGERARLAYLDYTTDALPYHLLDQPAVLVLGAGGGQAVLQALYHQAPEIEVVELDANMVRLVKEDHADFAGELYGQPEVTVHVAEARGFVSASPRTWDLLQLPLLDAAGAAASGVHGLSESYLYTVEAFELYLQHLEPGGWLAITRWLKLPPRDSLKLFATALEALRRQAIEAPERRLVLLRGLNTSTLLVKNGTVTTQEIDRARAFAESRSFDLCYYPGMTAEAANRFNVLDEPYFFTGAKALAGNEREAFLAGYKFDLAPASDDRPYFFDFLRWRFLPELLALRRTGGPGLLELGGVVLLTTFLQAVVLSALLILAPLGARRHGVRQAPVRWRVLAYFLALGLAFLFVEIAFIQKFILFLGHPLYAVAVVLTAFLLFAGLGSGLSSRIERAVASRRGLCAIELAVTLVIVLSLLYMLVLPTLFESLLPLPETARVAVSLALLAPLAFFMGMPFPLGLTRVSNSLPRLVPWAWGVNGCASVLSALLATLIATELGFSIVVLAAAALYAGAAVVFRRPLTGPRE